LTHNIESGNSFFHEVASHTVQWLKIGGSLRPRHNEPSIYWQLINRCYFRPPVCDIKIPHLKDINFFKLLKESLPNRIFDFWMLLANYGIHTRSRLGHNDSSRQCHLCQAIETTAHLFTSCPILANLIDILYAKIEAACGHKLTKSMMTIIYLEEMTQLPPVRSTRINMTFLVGFYLHSI
jgi:hypothetical protein